MNWMLFGQIMLLATAVFLISAGLTAFGYWLRRRTSVDVVMVVFFFILAAILAGAIASSHPHAHKAQNSGETMKHEYEFTNYTYCDPKYLDRSVITVDHLNFYADNCDTLAEYMKTVPKEKHIQHRWANDRTRDEACGTPACALGHAAYSNEFPGLQFGINGVCARGARQVIMPVINGGKVAQRTSGTRYSKIWADWSAAGHYFFGELAVTEVFGQAHLQKAEVIRALGKIAKVYRKRTKRIKKEGEPLSDAWSYDVDPLY